MVGGRRRKERSGRRKALGQVTRSKMDKNCSKMKQGERCESGLSDESDSCLLAEMCPDVTTVRSFHQGLGVKGRRTGGRIDLLYGGVDTTGACDTHADFTIHLFLLSIS